MQEIRGTVILRPSAGGMAEMRIHETIFLNQANNRRMKCLIFKTQHSGRGTGITECVILCSTAMY